MQARKRRRSRDSGAGGPLDWLQTLSHTRLGACLAARGLAADVEASANRGACLLGRAAELPTKAPQLAGADFDAKAGIASATLYDPVKRFFGDCAVVLRHDGDAKGAERFEKASMHWSR